MRSCSGRVAVINNAKLLDITALGGLDGSEVGHIELRNLPMLLETFVPTTWTDSMRVGKLTIDSVYSLGHLDSWGMTVFGEIDLAHMALSQFVLRVYVLHRFCLNSFVVDG